MPQVPYQPYPTAAPKDIPTPEVRVATPPAAFGENIGRALEHLGTVGEQAGNELFNRAVALQQLQNETSAKEADAKYMIEAGKAHEEFTALQGANASKEALDAHIKNLNDMRVQIRNDLPTDMSRKMYDASSLGFMGRNIFNAAGHAGKQQQVAAAGASTARVDAAQQYLYQNPDDPTGVENYKGLLAHEIGTQADLAGWTPEQREMQYKAHLSKGISMAIAGKAKNEPFTAAEWLEANKGSLREEDYNRLQNSVTGGMYATGARNIVDQVLADKKDGTNPDKPYKEYLSEAEEKAKALQKQYPYLTDIQSHVEQQFNAKWNRIEYGDRQFKNENINTLYGAMESALKKGALPASIEELTAHDEKAAAAFDALNDREKMKIRNAFAALVRSGDKVDDTTSLQTRNTLWGLAKNKPDEFLDVDLYSKDMKINPGDRKFLTNIRMKMVSGEDEDPRVPRALDWLRQARGAEMEALHVYNRREQYKDDYDHMVGALSDAIQTWEKEHNGRSPSRKETIDEIWPSISAHREGSFLPTWLGGTEEQPPLYAVPSAKIEAVKTQVKTDTGQDISDEQAHRLYVQAQLNALYKAQRTTAQK